MEHDPQSLWDQSALAWIEMQSQGEFHRVSLLDDHVLRAVGDVDGLVVVDVGCGEGRFARMLAERGAITIGVDPTAALIEQARLLDPEGEYHLAFADQIPVESESADLVIFYLVIIDIEHLQPALVEAARVLKPGGRVVVANIVPFRDSELFWERDSKGKKLFWKVHGYGHERGMLCQWGGMKIINYHRMLGTIFRGFLSAGFQLVDYTEILPTAEQLKTHRQLSDEFIAPNFDLAIWKKPD